MVPFFFREKEAECLLFLPLSGCSAAWLAHLHGVQVVGGSNPLTQIFCLRDGLSKNKMKYLTCAKRFI